MDTYRFSTSDFLFPPDEPSRPPPRAEADLRTTAFRNRVSEVEAETAATSLTLEEGSREFSDAAEKLDALAEGLLGGQFRDGVSAELLAACKLTPERGGPFLMLLARFKANPPGPGPAESAGSRAGLVVATRAREGFRHAGPGGGDVFMLMRCPGAGGVRPGPDEWAFDTRFDRAAVEAETEALRACLDRKTFREELPGEPCRCFLLDEVDAEIRHAYGASVAWGLVETFEGRDLVEVTAFDEEGGRYEVRLCWDARTGLLSMDPPTKTARA